MPGSSDLRIAVLGSGMMGRRHLEALAGIPGVRAVTRAERPYASLPAGDACEALLGDPAIDAVDICLPTSLHPWAVERAIANGKHVLCEKPLAPTVEGCRQTVALAGSSGRVFMVAHVVRFFPAYRELLRRVRGGSSGSLVSLHLRRESGRPRWAPWLLDETRSGGGVLDLLVHDFDQSIALAGAPDLITAAPIEGEHTVRCRLDYSRSGAPWVLIEGGWFPDGRAFAMGFTARFEGGRLEYSGDRLTFSPAGEGTAEETIELPGSDPYREQLRYFLGCCAGGSRPDQCPPEESAQAVELALAVRDLADRSPGARTAVRIR